VFTVWIKTFASQILREFAETRRRVISDWRIFVVSRRLALADNAPLPDERKAAAIRNELIRRGDLGSVEAVAGVYIVNVAYANLLEVSEEQIVQEANPWTVFGFLTAMTHHGLTDLVAKKVYAITSKNAEHSGRLPLGTMPDDWAGETYRPAARRPDRVGDVEVNWTQLTEEPGFGVIVGSSLGVPIYVTDVERTLLDALRMPDKSGGISKVLQAWRLAEIMDVAKIVSYANTYENKVLRQRVGFLLEKLGRTHPGLDEWKHGLQRGGSVKLVANSPYAETFSKEWNLSLNVPPSVLAIIEGD
jgi:predicted transcriptional regulator of viral defense system